MAVLLPVLAALLLPLALWWMDRAALQVETAAYLRARTVFCNALPGLLAMLLLWAATRRLLFSALLVCAAHALGYAASAIKLDVLGSPVSLQDSYFLTNLDLATFKVLGAYVEDVPLLPWCAAGIAVLALAFVLDRPWFVPRSRMRWGVFALSSALLASLWWAAWPWAALYTRDSVRPSMVASLPAVLHAGLVGSLVYKHLEVSNMPPRMLDMPALRATLAATGTMAGQTATAVPAGDAAPDIVIVMSESFIDPWILRGMDATPDVIPHTHGLLAAGEGGRMTVPTYGGGTVRTEFEALTGMPLAAFPATWFPYAHLQRPRMPGLARVLAAHGYATLAVHGNAGSFWNRISMYRNMGFERFLTEKDFAESGFRDGRWYSDESMTDIVLRELDKEHARPKFVFAISMQAHGPYEGTGEVKDRAAWQAIGLPAAAAQGEVEGQLRDYLYHVGKADEQLGRLLDALKQRRRPFVLAFFGDHLPSLPDAWHALGFTDGGASEAQQVPWILVGDRGAVGSWPPSSLRFSWQLPGRVLAAAGIHERYFDFIERAGMRMIDDTGNEEQRAVSFEGIKTAAMLQLEGKFEKVAK